MIRRWFKTVLPLLVIALILAIAAYIDYGFQP